MALFSSKPKKEIKEKKVENKPAVISATSSVSESRLSDVLIKPRVTEKAGVLSENRGVYIFEVAPWSSKKDIKDAVKEFYKVTPEKVSVVKIPSKKVFVRGKRGVKKGGKKAYVYLKKGEKIEV